MKTVLRKRYYCEFCKKAGGSAYHMRIHEERCTLNPKRKCGVCVMLTEEQPTMAALRKPFAGIELTKDEWGNVSFDTGAVDLALAQVREVSNNCPACIMAAIRQSGIPVPAVSDFNFTKEMRSVWSDINNAAQYEPPVCEPVL